MDSTIDKLLTPLEVAKIIGLEPRTLANWRSGGLESLPYIKLGGRIRYPEADVKAWLESKRAN